MTGKEGSGIAGHVVDAKKKAMGAARLRLEKRMARSCEAPSLWKELWLTCRNVTRVHGVRCEPLIVSRWCLFNTVRTLVEAYVVLGGEIRTRDV
jgi:hypothetical protein